MIAPTIVVLGTVVALWASIVGRTAVVIVAVAAACAAGSCGYVMASPDPLIISVPAALFGSFLCVVGIVALIIACNQGGEG